MRSEDMAALIERAQSTPGPQSFKDWIARLAEDSGSVGMGDGDSRFNLMAALDTLLLRAQMWDQHCGRKEPDVDRLRAAIALRILEAEE